MKNVLLAFSLMTASVSYCQSSLDKTISDDVCDCIRQSKKASENIFEHCLLSAFQKDSLLILREALVGIKDTSDQTGYQFGRALAGRISVSLIYTCPSYFHLMDTARYESIKKINKDSIQADLLRMANVDPRNRNKDFYVQRGLLYFQAGDLDNALPDFDNAIHLDQNAWQGIFFKAWTLELKKDYDQAFQLYTRLARETKKGIFDIYAAIAKQKKITGGIDNGQAR